MTDQSNLLDHINQVVLSTPVYDIHTHLFDPAFGNLLLWGIDEMLVYHYLVAEGFRHLSIPYKDFWKLPKSTQADLVWDSLFLKNSPISEASRGVLTTLNSLGLDVKKRHLPTLRQHFASQSVHQFVDQSLALANVRKVCMTNSPFDPAERPFWSSSLHRDPRFVAALRIDPLLLDWENTAPILHADGYAVHLDFSGQTFSEVRRFLADWTQKIDAQYLMVSLPPDFSFPAPSPAAQLIEHAILPHGRDHQQAFAMMIGVRRQLNPDLLGAGDGLGLADLSAVEFLAAHFPQNKFLVTTLALENQHALCVAARKFRNLHPFGCWWFLNNPSLIEHITRMRLELLGLSFTPQHSDSRVLDQLIYKWSHSRKIIAKVLAEKYQDLALTGWEPSPEEISRDVLALFGGSFERFLKN
ncbi:MAG: glucuronate isomerase [Verrucomicrobiota bacterium]